MNLVSVREARKFRQSEIKHLVRLHWIQRSDVEIAKLCGEKPQQIRRFRYNLGLLRKRGSKTGERIGKLRRFVRKRRGEIEHALTEGGKTKVDIIRDYSVGITRERMRQILNAEGIKHRPFERKAQWYAQRCGIPKLASSVRLTEMLTLEGSAREVALRLGISRWFVFKVADLLGIKNSFKRAKVNLIKLICRTCGSKFFRKPYKVAVTPSGSHYCSKHCYYGRPVRGAKLTGPVTGREITILCANSLCRRKIARRLSTIRLRQKSFYCSRPCWRRALTETS